MAGFSGVCGGGILTAGFDAMRHSFLCPAFQAWRWQSLPQYLLGTPDTCMRPALCWECRDKQQTHRAAWQGQSCEPGFPQKSHDMAWSVVLFWSFVLLCSFKGWGVILGENLHGFVFAGRFLSLCLFCIQQGAISNTL